MIPVVGPFITQFAGPNIAGFSKIAGKVKSMFQGLFGGPNADELTGRKAVAAFETQLHSALNATQELEAGGESWKRTVIALRDAYLANGRTNEESMQDAERLWRSSKTSAEEQAQLIAEIEAKMGKAGATAVSAIEGIDAALDKLPGSVDIPINIRRQGDPVGVDPGYATGTLGRHGDYFKNFGSGTPTMLHGNEAVITPRQAPGFAKAVLGGGGGGTDPMLLAALRDLPRAIKMAVREGLVMA
jgi:hypothetical protein